MKRYFATIIFFRREATDREALGIRLKHTGEWVASQGVIRGERLLCAKPATLKKIVASKERRTNTGSIKMRMEQGREDKWGVGLKCLF